MDLQKLLLVLALALVNPPLQCCENLNVIPSSVSVVKSSRVRCVRKLVNVKDHGARGDGVSYDNRAFAMAWKTACSSTAPATLLIPQGSTYLLKPMVLLGPCKSAVTVTIQGTILASAEISDWEGTDRSYWVLFNGVKNLKVNGGGTINGNGEPWWKISCKVDSSRECKNAPTAFLFRSCDNVKVKNLTFKDSQETHVTFELCTNVDVSNLAISASENSPNTDGVHVSGSTNVMITNCVIKTGDDCISIVGGSRSITATNIFCGPGHGISIGSLGANGAEEAVSDIMVDSARLEGTTNGVRIKTWQGGRGYARNITFRNIVMNNVKNPIIIDQNYCDSTKPCKENKSAVAISGVTFKNVRGTSATKVTIDFDCSRTVPCRGIVLQDINLVTATGESSKSIRRNVNLSKNSNFVP